MSAGVVRVGDVELSCTDDGTGDPAVLLVHGFTGSKEDFSDHVGWLAARGRVVTYDHRGHGASARAGAYGLDLLAGDLSGLVDELGLGRFVLLGHSMGGFVAQRYARAHPGRVAGLVLMDTGPGPLRLDPPRRQLAEAACRIAVEHGMASLLEAQRAFGPDELASDADARLRAERPGYAEFCDGQFLATDPAAYAGLLHDMLTQDDGRGALAGIDVETLVLVGEQDRPFLRGAEMLAAGIPRARLVRVPAAGHSPQFEAPGAWRAAMAEFLDALSP